MPSCQHSNSWTVFKAVNTPTAELFSKLSTHQQLNCFQSCQHTNTWTVFKGKVIKDDKDVVEHMWATLGTKIPPWTELNNVIYCGQRITWTTSVAWDIGRFSLQRNSASSKRLGWGMANHIHARELSCSPFNTWWWHMSIQSGTMCVLPCVSPKYQLLNRFFWPRSSAKSSIPSVIVIVKLV